MMNDIPAAITGFEALFKVASQIEASFKMNYKTCTQAQHMSGFTVNILPLYFR